MSEQFRIALEEYPMEWIVKLCGAQDKHLELLRNAFSCDIIMRDNELRILSEDAVTFHSIESVVKALFNMMEAHIDVSGRDIEYACRLAKLNRLQELSTTYQKAIGKTVNGKLIYPKTIGQRHLFKCMCNSEIVFATGVAGTGKTYLAVVYAADLLKKGEIRKIILTRPAVEAGENLGFLPGDLQSKIDPYLRPLYDALYQIMGAESYLHNSEKGLIEVAPLAYMRGRTLDNAFIILDEAQNTTPAQMKMFLTRIGFGSKVIVTGDQSQKDLPAGAASGLDTAIHVLKKIDDIGFCYLTSSDVVRHPLVQKIVKAYDDYEARMIKRKRSPRLNKRPDKGNR